MNYKYIIDKREVVLSDNEHKSIVEAMKKNKNDVVILRGGNLILGLTKVEYANTTDEPTQEELEARENALKLAPKDPTTGKNVLGKYHYDLYKKMGWEHGTDCLCRKEEKDTGKYGNLMAMGKSESDGETTP